MYKRQEGGQSGFASGVTALWFVLSVFLIPVFSAIPGYATASVLVLVGTLMVMGVKKYRLGGCYGGDSGVLGHFYDSADVLYC